VPRPSKSTRRTVRGDLIRNWAPDGSRVAAAGADGTVSVVDAGSGAVAECWRHDGPTTTVAWGPALASGGQDARLFIDARPADAGAWVQRLAWRPDGGLLAAASGRRVSFWTAGGARTLAFGYEFAADVRTSR
jgi:WD40 repeat protein